MCPCATIVCIHKFELYYLYKLVMMMMMTESVRLWIQYVLLVATYSEDVLDSNLAAEVRSLETPSYDDNDAAAEGQIS